MIKRELPPIRVLFVNDHLGYAHGEIHGVTRYLTSTLPSFDRSRVHPFLCILRGRHPEADKLEQAGIAPVFLNRGKWSLGALSDLYSVIRTCGADLVHLAGVKGMLLGRLAARRMHCRAIVHFHDTIELGFPMRMLQRPLARWTDAAIAVSEPVRDLWVRQFGLRDSQCEVVPNGLPIQDFSSPPEGARECIRHEFGLDADAPVVGAIGRMHEVKGQHVLLKAWPEVLRMCPSAKLLLIGDGPNRPACESLAQELGIGASVRFAGFRADIPSLLAAIDVVAMPSLWEEGFGLSALEAIAAGRPVVGFRVGALALTVVEDRTGSLVPRGDTTAMAATLGRFLTDKDLHARLSAGAREHARRFSIEEHVRRLTDIYEKLRMDN